LAACICGRAAKAVYCCAGWLCGTDKIRKAIESGALLKEIETSWAAGLNAFGEARRASLLYSPYLDASITLRGNTSAGITKGVIP